jgi:hypothetical protein
MHKRLKMKAKKFSGLGILSIVMTTASVTPVYAAEVTPAHNDANAQQSDGVIAQNGEPAGLIRSATSTVTENYLGSAPYICTPSGFGERSKCVLRSRARANRVRAVRALIAGN